MPVHNHDMLSKEGRRGFRSPRVLVDYGPQPGGMKEKDGSQMGDILRDMPVEGVCRLTLNRPDALNSLTYTMYAELIDHLEGVRYDHDVRVVILTGAGRGFCAGHARLCDLRHRWTSAV